MGFIPDSEIEKQQKIQEINRKVQIKREQHLITEKANEPTAKKNENITFMREIEKANRHNKPPKPIGLKEIKQQLEFQKLIVENQEEQIRGLLAEPEMMEIKNELVNVMAIPHTHPDKRRLFAHKLQNSQTVTNYVDQNVMFRFFNHANSHIKFGVVYGLKYLQTNSDYSQYLKQMKALELQKATEEPNIAETESNSETA
jgi:hypothetical protein